MKNVCLVCNCEFNNQHGMIIHITKNHMKIKEYYDIFFRKENDGICLKCQKQTKFISINKGYHKYCSLKCSVNSNDVLEKRKCTNLLKYNVEYPIQNIEIKKKIKNTNIKKYGTDNPFGCKEIKYKIKETNLNKYGFDNPMKNICLKNKSIKNKKNNTIEVIEKISDYLDINILEDFIDSHYKHKWLCRVCNNTFIRTWNKIQQGCICPYCIQHGHKISQHEINIREFIKSLNLDIIENDRKIIKPYELDIYIPGKNIAIEFDGLYYHSSKFKIDKNYHLNKTKLCEKYNIQLIHIFEDEWIYKQEIVKSRLKQILGMNNNIQKIYARKCEIEEISPKTKNKFLNEFHIQGEDKSNIKLGAFYKGELISVMTFSKGNISKGSKNIHGNWELNRFCSNYNYHIPGIASKLLSYFKNNIQWKEIFSYADRRWSLGNLYKKIGFELDSITNPNYWYINNYIRIHRFALRKKSNEPKEIPEWVLRQEEGYYRIWDCGHYKFIIKKI